MKSAEPIPCLSVGTLLMTALKLGATNNPVPIPSNTKYTLSKEYVVVAPEVEKRNKAILLRIKPVIVN